MEKQPDSRKTLGQAIDEIVQALSSLDAGTRVTAIRAACDHLKIQPPQNLAPNPPASSASNTSQAPQATVPSRQVDIQSLKQQKQPSSAIEMAAVAAFYLSELVPENERKLDVDKDDMEKYFKQARFPLPKMQFLLLNAKNAGYFDSAGGGKYRLNPVGYNLVAHSLPRDTSQANSGARKRRPKTTRKAKKQRPKT